MNRGRRMGAAFLAAVITFGTVFSQVPTLAVEDSAQTKTQRVLACQMVPHKHTEECYRAAGEGRELICGQADYVIHEHNSDCYDADGNLACTLPVIKEHRHSSACYTEQTDMVCGMEEGQDGHVHTAECYTLQQEELLCGIPEGHVHQDVCYQWDSVPGCGQEEAEGVHTHTEECYILQQGELLCDTPEQHVHGEECWQWESVLSCGLQEGEGAHVHTDSCFLTEQVLTCTEQEIYPHTHSAACYGEGDALICGETELKEHIHGDECFQEVKEQKTETESETEAETKTETETETESETEAETEIETETETETEKESGIAGASGEVIQLIRALPPLEELAQTLADYKAAGDEEGRSALLVEACTQAQAAHDAYEALTEEEKAKINEEDIDRLDALKALWGQELSQEELQQAFDVIALIADLPTWEEVRTNIEELSAADSGGTETETAEPAVADAAAVGLGAVEETIALLNTGNVSVEETETISIDGVEADGEDPAEAYFMEVYEQAAAAWDSYETLNGVQKEQVVNVDKLETLLAGIQSMQANTLAEAENTNILDYNSEDGVYITSILETAVISGTSETLDSTAGAGYDNSLKDQILRTFDKVTYEITYTIKPRNSGSTYDGAYIYYEIILPVDAEKADIVVDDMAWVKSSDKNTYVLEDAEIDGTKCRMLRGRFYREEKIRENSDNAGTLDVIVQAKNMKNEDTFQPWITMWIGGNCLQDGNTKGYSENGTTGELVTGTLLSNKAAEKGNNSTSQTVNEKSEQCQLVLDQMTISAKASYNVRIGSDDAATNTYDFGTGIDGAKPNPKAGERYGRMIGLGIAIEIVPLTHGTTSSIMGVEVPDQYTKINFTITTDTDILIGTQEANSTLEAKYAALFWSGGENSASKTNKDGREITGMMKFCTNMPYNYGPEKEEGVGTALPSEGNSCYNGGTWTFAWNGSSKSVDVSVTNFEINMDKMPEKTTGGTKLYNSKDGASTEDKYVFSAGELWVLQPYKNAEAVYVQDEAGENSKLIFNAKLSDVIWTRNNGNISGADYDNTNDNSYSYTRDLFRKGLINTMIEYTRAGASWDQAEIRDGMDPETMRDYAAEGETIGINIKFEQQDSSGKYRGAAMDIFLKFDDRFFEPTGVRAGHFNSGSKEYRGSWYYVGKMGGWHEDEDVKPYDEGYDNAMLNATPYDDDLAFFTSMEELKEAGYKCVGIFGRMRHVYADESNEYAHIYVDGKVVENGEGIDGTDPNGYVYMIAFNTYAWSVEDLGSVLCGGELAGEVTDKQLKTLQDETADQINNRLEKAISEKRFSSYEVDTGVRGALTGQKGDVNYASYKDDSGTSSKNTKSPIKSKYYNGEWTDGDQAWLSIDSCLKIAYEARISKKVAKQVDGAEKTTYDISTGNDTKVVYALEPSAHWMSQVDENSNKTTTVTITDVIPAGLKLSDGVNGALDGNWIWSEQGEDINLVYDSTTDSYSGYYRKATKANDESSDFTVETEENDDGSTNVTIKLLNVNPTLGGGTDISFGRIYYSCKINTNQGDKELKNTATIRSTEDANRVISEKNNNESSRTIETTKQAGLTINKIADNAVVEEGDDIGYTIVISNPTAKDWDNLLITDNLPDKNDKDHSGTTKTNAGKVKEMSYGIYDEDDEIIENGNFTFFYGTRSDCCEYGSEEYYKILADYGGATEENFKKFIKAQDGGWGRMEFETATKARSTGLSGSYKSWKNPDVNWTNTTNLTRNIVAIGSLPAGATLKIHVTLEMDSSVEKPLDVFANRVTLMHKNLVSTSGTLQQLESIAKVRIVQRNLEGRVWLDKNMDGIQDAGELGLTNEGGSAKQITVTLQKVVRRQGGGYIESGDAMVIKTGQQYDYLGEEGEKITSYDAGYYRFTNLPEGTYMIRFGDEDGKELSGYTASPVNVGDDDSIDSDGVPTPAAIEVKYTKIQYVTMPSTSTIDGNTGSYTSKNNDSGFYEDAAYNVLPMTGSSEMAAFRFAGLALLMGGVWLSFNKRRNMAG